jgi:hypothetical protein
MGRLRRQRRLRCRPPVRDTPIGPVAVAVGDFNGDGIPDLAVANDSRFATGVPDSVTILLGNGDGTFTLQAESPTIGDNPADITVGDFNGDGVLDLAVANLYVDTLEPGTVTVLLGNGNGTFTPTPVSPVTGFLPYSVAIGDFNADGKADLVTANAGSNTVTVLLGNGDGTFAAPLNPPAGTDPIFAAVGDFNGDGLTDVAAANNSTLSVTVLLAQETEKTATATVTGISPIGGQQLVEASYGGDSTYLASSSSTVSLTGSGLVTPTVTVTPSAPSITTAQTLTVTIGVTGTAGNATPTGTATLTSGNYSSMATTLASGSAMITIPAGSLAVGMDTLTGSHSGDNNYSVASGTSSVTVTAAVTPTFTITGTPVSVAPGATTGNTSTITVAPGAEGFSGTIALTAAITSIPPGANDLPTLSSLGTVILSGNSAAATRLTISTTAPSSGALIEPARPAVRWHQGGTTLALFCGIGIAIRTRRRSRHTRLGMIFLVILTAGLIACGSGGPGTPGTTAGNYMVTVTGTSGSTTATGTFTLTVQ